MLRTKPIGGPRVAANPRREHFTLPQNFQGLGSIENAEKYMGKARTLPIDSTWIALPGLFTDDDLVGAAGFDLYAIPLVILGGRVLYGVYVRDESWLDLFEASADRRSTEPPSA